MGVNKCLPHPFKGRVGVGMGLSYPLSGPEKLREQKTLKNKT